MAWVSLIKMISDTPHGMDDILLDPILHDKATSQMDKSSP